MTGLLHTYFRLDLQCLPSDTSLFVRSVGSSLIYLLLYVDDIVIAGLDSDYVHRLKLQLSSEFQISDLGKLSYFSGLRFTLALVISLSIKPSIFMTYSPLLACLLLNLVSLQCSPSLIFMLLLHLSLTLPCTGSLSGRYNVSYSHTLTLLLLSIVLVSSCNTPLLYIILLLSASFVICVVLQVWVLCSNLAKFLFRRFVMLTR